MKHQQYKAQLNHMQILWDVWYFESEYEMKTYFIFIGSTSDGRQMPSSKSFVLSPGGLMSWPLGGHVSQTCHNDVYCMSAAPPTEDFLLYILTEGSGRTIYTTYLTHWSLGDASFNLAFMIAIFRSSYDNTLIWMSYDLTDDKSTLVQVMAWCRQAPSHYLSQCWPRYVSPHGVTRPQWVN